ncbi:MAG: sigma-E factor negative regulatory protein [Thiotrichales bacterium]
MKHTESERLSAAIDGELTSFETRQALRDALRDQKLAAKWARYHLIGDAMRGEVPRSYDHDLAKRISRRIALEGDAPRPAAVSAESSWARTLGGLAIAASVAAISLVSLKLLTSHDNGMPDYGIARIETPGAALSVPQPGLPEGVVAIGEVAVQPVSTDGAGRSATESEALGAMPTLRDPRLNSYLATHAEFAARSGLMARTRVVGFEAPQE